MICNKERRGALANLYATIHRCQDNAIVVTVDGDDQLAHPDVLKELNKVYTKQLVWLTHGKLQETESKELIGVFLFQNMWLQKISFVVFGVHRI